MWVGTFRETLGYPLFNEMPPRFSSQASQALFLLTQVESELVLEEMGASRWTFEASLC